MGLGHEKIDRFRAVATSFGSRSTAPPSIRTARPTLRQSQGPVTPPRQWFRRFVLDPHVLTRPGTVLLDTARPGSVNRRCRCFTTPRDVFVADTPAEVPRLLDSLQEATEAGRHVAGYLTYEAGYPFVDLETPVTVEGPVAWFGVYDRPHVLAPAEVERGLEAVDGTPVIEDAELSVSRDAYVDAVQRIRRHIGAGDVYQINYTAPVHFRSTGDPRSLYRRLRRQQRVPYGAYLNSGDRHILCCSPELFFRCEGNRVMTRPMRHHPTRTDPGRG